MLPGNSATIINHTNSRLFCDYWHPIRITNPWFQILIFILIQKLPDHAGRRFHKYNL